MLSSEGKQVFEIIQQPVQVEIGFVKQEMSGLNFGEVEHLVDEG